jgi:hypothetical protein
MTHKQLLESCDAEELAEWESFWLIEPWGDEWRQTARLATALCTAWGSKNLEEEMIMPSSRKPQQTVAQMLGELQRAAKG